MDYAEKRKRMVEGQIAGRGISDPKILESFLKVKRHKFIPEALKEDAYADSPLPIGEGQTISQPYIVALMTECLGLEGGEKVLEIGTGSGYQAAVLASLGALVYTVERNDSLLKEAKGVLEREGFMDIFFKCSDGSAGWKEEAPFDRIIVTAAAPEVPEPLKDQLADGGRMVVPIGSRFSQALTVIERDGKKYQSKLVCSCVFVPLVGEYGWKN